MHIIPLIVLFVLSLYGAVFIIAGVACKQISKYYLIQIVLPIGLCAWLITSMYQNKEIIKSETYKIETIASPKGKIQIIWSEDRGMINLNKYFGCQLPENSKVKLVKYSKTYCGIYFETEKDQDFKLEIVN